MGLGLADPTVNPAGIHVFPGHYYRRQMYDLDDAPGAPLYLMVSCDGVPPAWRGSQCYQYT